MSQVESNNNVLIETAQNLKEGNLPSNEQATQIIEKAKQFLDETKEDTRLDAKTIKVLSDAHELAEATKQLIENKNADEKVQKLVGETIKAAKMVPQNEISEAASDVASDVASKIDTEKVKEEASNITNGALEMIKILLRSGEFRSYVLDLLHLFQDILINDVAKAVKQPEEQEKPEQEQKPQEQTDESTKQSKEPANSLLQPGSSADMGTTTIVLAGSMGNRGFAPGEVEVTNDIIESATNTQESEQKQEKEEKPEKQEKSEKQEKQDTSSQSEESSTKDWDFKIPDDKMHELSFRLMNLFRKIPSNSQFKQGMNFFSMMLKDLTAEAKNNETVEKVNEHLKTVFDHAKSIIAEFSGESVDALFDSMKEFMDSLKNDEKMKNFINEIQSLFNEVVSNPQVLEDYSFVGRIEKLSGEGRSLMRETEWRQRYEHVFSQSSDLWTKVKNDKHIQNLADKAQQFMDNFTYIDSSGQRCLNQDLVGQMRHIIIPLFIELLDKVPIPPIEGSNETYDYKFQNMTLSGYDIIPDRIQFHTSTDFDLDVKRMKTSKAFTKIDMRINNILTKMEGVQFWFSRKTFPKLEDQGVADVAIEGEGMNLNIHFTISLEANTPTFNVSNVDVNIDQLTISIKEATHSILLTIWSTIYQGTIKTNIAKTVEDKIKTVFQQMETGFNNLLASFPSSRLLDVAKDHIIGNTPALFSGDSSKTEDTKDNASSSTKDDASSTKDDASSTKDNAPSKKDDASSTKDNAPSKKDDASSTKDNAPSKKE